MGVDIEKNCFICKEGLKSDTVEVKKGMDNLKRASVEREDGNIQFLEKLETITVHNRCRNRYVCKRSIQSYKNKLKAEADG